MIIFIHTLIVLATKLSVFPFLSFAVSEKTVHCFFCCCCFYSWYCSGGKKKEKGKWLFPHIFVCPQIDTRAESFLSHMCACMQAHRRSFVLPVRSQKRPDTAVFSSVELGTLPPPVNNGLTSAHAAAIAGKLERFFFSTGQAVERLSLGLIISGCTWEESVQGWGKERLVSDRNNRAIPDNFTWSGEVIFKCYTKGCFDSHLVSCSCSLQCYSRFWNPGCSV